MRAVLQRVQSARITIDHRVNRKIGIGLLVLIGFEENDTEQDLDWLASKIINLRIFSDEEGRMNLSVRDIGGDIMVVSQFTLHASTKKGNRPSWVKAAPPEFAQPMYLKFVDKFEELHKKKIITGEFGAHMDIALINDGPVTLFIDTKNKE